MREQKGVEILPGTPLQVELELPEQADPVRAAAEVVWVDPEDRDASGRPVLGLGMQMANDRRPRGPPAPTRPRRRRVLVGGLGRGLAGVE